MLPVDGQPQQPVLQACRGEAGEPEDDVHHGQAFNVTPHRRGRFHGVPAQGDGLSHRPQAHPQALQAHGQGNAVPKEEPDKNGHKGVQKAVPAQKHGHCPCQPGMEYRHYIYPHEEGVHVPDSGHGCVQP